MIHGLRSYPSTSVALFLALLAAGCPSDDTDDGVASQESGNDSGNGNTNTTAADGATEPTESADSSTEDSGVITNGCGTFDTNGPGDSQVPQDPDHPDIITACTALCNAMAGVADCTTDPATCLDACKQRSCPVCPGTLAPLVSCEAELFDAATCECGSQGAMCETPAPCADLADATSQCGG